MEARLISPAGAASLSMTEIRDAAARDGATLWLDFDHTDEASMALLGELMDVRPSDIQECHNRSPVPKMRFYADHHFSAINGLARGSDGRPRVAAHRALRRPWFTSVTRSCMPGAARRRRRRKT